MNYLPIFLILFVVPLHKATDFSSFSPSFVYQLICNASETHVIHKVINLLNYSTESLENFQNNATKNYEDIKSQCFSEFSQYKCEQISFWNETLETLMMQKTWLIRNLSNIEENIAEIDNSTNETKTIYQQKLKEILEKKHEKMEDLEMLQEVEKLIQKEGFSNNTDHTNRSYARMQMFLEKISRLHNKIKLKKAQKIHLDDIIEQVLLILRDVKYKIIRQIQKLKIKEKTLKKWVNSKTLELNREKARNIDKGHEIKKKLLELSEKQTQIQANIQKCQEITQFQDIYCKNIEKNATIFFDVLTQELKLLKASLLLLNEDINLD